MAAECDRRGRMPLSDCPRSRQIARHNEEGETIKRPTSFPQIGFLLLGIASLVAAVVFVVRAAAVEATAVRLWSAFLYALFGGLWILAYWYAVNHKSETR